MHRALNAGVLLLSVGGSAATLVVTFRTWLPQSTTEGALAIIFLGTFMSILAVAIVWQEYRFARKTRYAEALPYLNRIFFETERFSTDSQTVDEIETLCKLIVNRLAAAFSLITGTKCSVCIKASVQRVNHGTKARPKVVTLCRDDTSLEREQGSSPRESWIAELENPESVNHWIEENTAFSYIWRNPANLRRPYFSNYLPNEARYDNTSFKLYGYPPTTNWTILRDLRWPLPYKSTIVAPIGRLTPLRRSYQLAGFLAVDSRSRFVFNKRYDLDLTLGVADCLFNLVHQYNERVADMHLTDGGEYDGEDV